MSRKYLLLTFSLKNYDQSFNPLRLRRLGSDLKSLSFDSSKYVKRVFGLLTPSLILLLMAPESAKLQFVLFFFFFFFFLRERLIRIPFCS